MFPIHEFSSFQQTPEFYSPSPAHQGDATFDLVLHDELDRRDAWSEVPNSWLVCLFRGKDLVFRRRGEDQWYLSLGDMNSIIAFG